MSLAVWLGMFVDFVFFSWLGLAMTAFILPLIALGLDLTKPGARIATKAPRLRLARSSARTSGFVLALD